MKKIDVIKIDLKQGKVSIEYNNGKEVLPIGSPDAFEVISQAWLRCGWDTKYVYSFTWLGRPIIQLPEDMIRIQETIYKVKPDVIIETGIAHGGSLIYYASICKAMGKGRVVGVDIEIRPQNRKAIEAHELFEYITLIEGNAIAPEIIRKIENLVKADEHVLVILDSNHSKEHVLAELRAYSKMVSVGSYIVACDGIMGHLSNAPRTDPDWSWNNPENAVQEFVKENPNFMIREPVFPFNEGAVSERVTYWPNAFIQRK